MSKKTTTSKLTDTLKIKMRNDFVQGISDESGIKNMPTLDELATKYNIAKSTLYRVSKNENWKIEKEKFEKQYFAELDKERISSLQKESIKFDRTSLDIANALMLTVGQAINQNTLDRRNGKKGLPPNQLVALSTTAKQAQQMAKLALGEATHNIDATVTENNEAFTRAMELLDELEDSRFQSNRTAH